VGGAGTVLRLDRTIISYTISRKSFPEDQVLTREFVYTESFRRCWKAMGLSDVDLKALEEILLPRLVQMLSEA